MEFLWVCKSFFIAPCKYQCLLQTICELKEEEWHSENCGLLLFTTFWCMSKIFGANVLLSLKFPSLQVCCQILECTYYIKVVLPLPAALESLQPVPVSGSFYRDQNFILPLTHGLVNDSGTF